jgi:hypothetical protein
MTFKNLPSDWAQRPITDADLFEGVIDLAVPESSRATGGVYVLLCHADGRLLQAVSVGDGVALPPVEELESGLQVLLTGIAEIGVSGACVAIARPGCVEPTPDDHRLRVACEEACAAAGMDLLGVAIAVPGDVVALPSSEASDAA